VTVLLTSVTCGLAEQLLRPQASHWGSCGFELLLSWYYMLTMGKIV